MVLREGSARILLENHAAHQIEVDGFVHMAHNPQHGVQMSYRSIKRQLLQTSQGVGLLDRLQIRARLLILPLDQLLEEALVGERTLDLGCGVGLVSRALALQQPACHVVGLDLNFHRLQVAHRSCPPSLPLSFVCGSVEQMPFRGLFSAVFCVDVLHHVPYSAQAATLASIREMLHPEGVLWVKEIDLMPRWKYWFNFVHDSVYNRQKPRCRGVAQWQQLLTKSGFVSDAKRIDRRSPYPHILLRAWLRNLQ